MRPTRSCRSSNIPALGSNKSPRKKAYRDKENVSPKVIEPQSPNGPKTRSRKNISNSLSTTASTTREILNLTTLVAFSERRPTRSHKRILSPVNKTVRAPRSRPKPLEESPTKNLSKKLTELRIVPAAPTPKKRSATEILENIRDSLKPNKRPPELPCREDEYETISTFIRENVNEKTSGCIYISGVPGTGKTATVTRVIEDLQQDEFLPEFTYVMVNAMRLSNINGIFVALCRQLELVSFGQRISPTAAMAKLTGYFQNGVIGRNPVVCLLDEVDHLCNKRQNVLYQLFDWAYNHQSKLTILAISNTLDLPERLLIPRVASRMGLNRLCFKPYDHKEIGSILRSRLSGLPAIENDAIEFASRKVASVSGDLRKAMEISRKAVDKALAAKDHTIKITHMQKVLEDLSQQTRTVGIGHCCSIEERKMLEAAVSLQKRQNRDELDSAHLWDEYLQLNRIKQEYSTHEPMSHSQFSKLFARLTESRLLHTDLNNRSWSKKFRLPIPAEDILVALNLSQ